MCRAFHVMSDHRCFCVCATQEKASECAKRLRSRGHTVWIELMTPADGE